MAKDGNPSAIAPEKNDPELAALQLQVNRAKLEKELADARKATAEADRAALEAQLPKTSTKGPEGNVALLAGAGYFSELLAYRSLETAAAEISTQIGELTGTIILTDQFDLSSHEALWALIDGKLKDFESKLDEALQRFVPSSGETPPVKAAFIAPAIAVPLILGAAAEVAAFFRVNREITGRAVTLSQKALLAEVANAMIKKKLKVVLPGLSIGAPNSLMGKLSMLQRKRRELLDRRQKLRAELDPDPARVEQIDKEIETQQAKRTEFRDKDPKDPRIPELDASIAALAKERATKAEAIKRWKNGAEEIDLVIQEFTALETTLTTRPVGETQSPLEAVAIIDAIRAQGAKSKILYVSVVSQGGEVEITKNAWTSGNISYIGGSVVAYFLFGGDGALEKAKTVAVCLTDSFKGSAGAKALGWR